MPAVRSLAATYMAGYSRLMAPMRNGRMSAQRLTTGSWSEPKVQEHRGRIAKNTGDAFLAEFARVVDAVRDTINSAVCPECEARAIILPTTPRARLRGREVAGLRDATREDSRCRFRHFDASAMEGSPRGGTK
jgi:class 3 adenylate cyclase